jgi:ATP-dependent Lhr-like helicase
MRGRLHPETAGEEWCERRLLARIHRYTVKRLRAEIEAVPAKDFLRFLCEWQRVLPAARMQGSDALAAVLAQLEGFEAPAGAWETEIIPSRIAEYDPSGWTSIAARDASCGRGWRRAPRRVATSRRRATGVHRRCADSLDAHRVARQAQRRCCGRSRGANGCARLTSKAQAAADVIKEFGASFFDEIAQHAGLLPTEAEDALAELVAVGLVNSDSFAGLRVLLMPRGAARQAEFIRRQTAAQYGAVRHGGCRTLGTGAAADVRLPPRTRRSRWLSRWCARCCAVGA